MKKIKLGGKLNLNKETVTELNKIQMIGILGLGGDSLGLQCNGGNTRACGTTLISQFCPTQVPCVTNKSCYVTDAISACQSRCGDIAC
jgi:hypothetical protein